MKKTAILVLLVVFTLMIGWVMNVIKLVSDNDFASPYKSEVIRIVGIFVPPIGMVTGYMTFEGEE